MYPTRKWYGPRGWSVRRVKGAFQLIRAGRGIGIIRTIDDLSVFTVHRRNAIRVSSKSSEYRRHQATKFLLLAKGPGICTVVVTQRGRRKTFNLRRVTIVPRSNPRRLKVRTVAPGVAYVNIPSWSSSTFHRQTIRTLALRLKRSSLRGIILDLRENGGGSTHIAFELAGHFFGTRADFGLVQQRTPEMRLRGTQHHLWVEPQLPLLNAPVAILTDIETLSTSEIFTAGMHDNKRALLVGRQTGGSSGNPVTVTISFRRETFTTLIATWNYIRPNGKPLEGVGIVPTHAVTWNSHSRIDLVVLTALRSFRAIQLQS